MTALYLAVLVLCVSAVCAAPRFDSQLEGHWHLWKNWHSKNYHESEEGWRRMIWEKNLKKIEIHNLEHTMGKHSYRLGMNHFGDMTNEEFRQTMNGYKQTTERKFKGSLFMEPNYLQAPKAVDWREKGYVTPVKDQGSCGSCWAFSTTGAMEGQQFRKTGKLVSLSEQNLVDCSRPEGNEGCNGGLMDQAFQYIQDNAGLDTEESYPYVGTDEDPCHYKPEFSAANETGFVDIPSGKEHAMMKAVAAVGPVSVAIDAGHESFQFYESGIYYEKECSSEELDHGVLVVGYGFEGEDVDGKKYWIVKNSWSEKWGDKGYIYMAKDRKNHCGIAKLLLNGKQPFQDSAMATEGETWTTVQKHDGVLSFDDDVDHPYGDEDEAAFEAEVNGNWTPQEKALHEARLKAKAKRRVRKSSSRSESLSESLSGELADGDSPKGKVPVPNDRKSRTGKGRGLPKKGGAGGKGVWGAAGMVYEVEEPDVKDPNYDEVAQGDTVYATVVPELDERELEKTVNPIVQEYFQHGDTKEVQMLLKELNLGHHKYEFSSLAVSLSLEGKASHRELTSRLLRDLVGKGLSESDMARAFDKILKELPDLMLDTPEAPQMLGQFIARAIADHALPMAFLDRYKGKVDCDHARAALDRAAVLLSMKREMVRLDNVWGVGGGLRPVKHLVKEMNFLLKEYLVSGEVKEAERCLRDLEVPHFHHELVYEAVVMVLESKGDTAVKMMCKLLQAFWKIGLITVDQMNRGFQRVYDELPEINLDVPHAHSIMESFTDLCYQESVITKQLRDSCPSRGRKRFVSEGDGGLIKN